MGGKFTRKKIIIITFLTLLVLSSIIALLGIKSGKTFNLSPDKITTKVTPKK